MLCQCRNISSGTLCKSLALVTSKEIYGHWICSRHIRIGCDDGTLRPQEDGMKKQLLQQEIRDLRVRVEQARQELKLAQATLASLQ